MAFYSTQENFLNNYYDNDDVDVDDNDGNAPPVEDIDLNNEEYDEESKRYLFDDEDDDDEYYNGRNSKDHSLPSVEEARLYAGRILNAKSTNEIYGRGEKIPRRRKIPKLPVCIVSALILLIFALMGLITNAIFIAISATPAPTMIMEEEEQQQQQEKKKTTFSSALSASMPSSSSISSTPSLSPTIIDNENNSTEMVSSKDEEESILEAEETYFEQEAALEEGEILVEEIPLEEGSIQQAQPLSSEQQTGAATEESKTESLLKKLCPNDNNFQDMYKFLDSTTSTTPGDGDDDEELVYMIEMVKFQDESLYQEYVNGLIRIILPNIDGAKIVFRMKNPITPTTLWDEILIIQYPKKMYDRLYGFGNTEYNTMKNLLEKRTMALQQSSVWAASLNQDINMNYPGLLINENTSNNNSNDNLMIHGYKYKDDDTNQEESEKDAKNIMANYDLITENVKSNNGMYTLAWFDIHVSCTNNNLDQIRVETMGNYPAAIINSDWYQGLQYLDQGIDEDHSLSTFATQSISTNLYKK